MIIRNERLARYRSKEYCNLDMFKLAPPFHLQKKWKSRDGKVKFVKDMDTMHLWHTFNMLQGIIDSEEFIPNSCEGLDHEAWNFYFMDLKTIEEQAEVARNAIQYIGHELYKRGAQVPRLPEKDFRKKINRADNLHRGFSDKPGELLDYDDEDGPGEIGWDNGEFYKR